MRKNLLQIALESDSNDSNEITPDTLGSELEDGYQETLKALVLDGPLDDGSLPSKSAAWDLINHGYAAKVLVKGEEPDEATYATFKGRDLYIQCLGFNPQETTLKEALDSQASTPSTEGFKDWVKDFFTFKINTEKINKGVFHLAAIEATKKAVQNPITFSASSRNITSILEMTVKNGVIVKDLPRAISADAEGFAKVNTILMKVNGVLESLSKLNDNEAIAEKIRPILTEDLFTGVNNQHWLFSVKTTSSKGKIKSEFRHPDFVFSVDDYAGSGELEVDEDKPSDSIDKMIEYYEKDKKQEQDFRRFLETMKELNKAFDFDVPEFKRASTQLETVFKKSLETLTVFNSHYSQYGKSQIGEVRALLRIGHRTSTFLLQSIQNFAQAYTQLERFTY